jgi:hypothetical protein
MQLQTLRAELADARRAAADAEVAASAAKRATASSREEASIQVAAARTAAAEHAVQVTSLPNGGMGASNAELLAALAARDVHLQAMQGELAMARGVAQQGARDKDRMVSELAAIEQRLLDELAAAQAAHEAAHQSAADVANNAAEVMTALSAQLDAERSAREAAERQLASAFGGDAMGGMTVGGAFTYYSPSTRNNAAESERPSRSASRAKHHHHRNSTGGRTPSKRQPRDSESGDADGGLVAPGVLRGVAAGVLAGLVARWGMVALGSLGGRMTEKTGQRAAAQAAPQGRAERDGPYARGDGPPRRR